MDLSAIGRHIPRSSVETSAALDPNDASQLYDSFSLSSLAKNKSYIPDSFDEPSIWRVMR